MQRLDIFYPLLFKDIFLFNLNNRLIWIKCETYFEDEKFFFIYYKSWLQNFYAKILIYLFKNILVKSSCILFIKIFEFCVTPKGYKLTSNIHIYSDIYNLSKDMVGSSREHATVLDCDLHSHWQLSSLMLREVIIVILVIVYLAIFWINGVIFENWKGEEEIKVDWK